MPIKKENKHRYPKNWKDIRASILTRAGHRCEVCRVQNYAVGQRIAGRWIPICGNLVLDAAGQGRNYEANRAQTYKEARMVADINNAGEYEDSPFMVIILTIAHLDHTPENNNPENLRALCQRCHLKYDAQHHASNARRTIAAKRANNFQTVLFT